MFGLLAVVDVVLLPVARRSPVFNLLLPVASRSEDMILGFSELGIVLGMSPNLLKGFESMVPSSACVVQHI